MHESQVRSGVTSLYKYLIVSTVADVVRIWTAMHEDFGDKSKQALYLEERKTLGHWASKQAEEGEMRKYQKDWNHDSLDGLPGLGAARVDCGKGLWIGDVKKLYRRNPVIKHMLTSTMASMLTVIVLKLLGHSILKWTSNQFLAS